MKESFEHWQIEEQPLASPGNADGFEHWWGDEPIPGPSEELLEPRPPASYFDGPTIF